MVDVPQNRSAARLLASPNPTRMRTPLSCKCSKTTLSQLTSCVLALVSFRLFWCLMWNEQMGCRKYLLTRFGIVIVSIRDLAWVSSWERIPTRTYVLWSVLGISAAPLFADLREHISAKEVCDDGFCSPFFSMISFLCSIARCCVVADNVDLKVSYKYSGSWLPREPEWAFV